MAYKLNLYRKGVYQEMLGHTAYRDTVVAIVVSFEKENGLHLERVDRPEPMAKMGGEYPVTIECHDFELGRPIRWWHFVESSGAG